MRKYEYTVLVEDGTKMVLTTLAASKAQAIARLANETAMLDNNGKVKLITVIKSSFRWVD